MAVTDRVERWVVTLLIPRGGLGKRKVAAKPAMSRPLTRAAAEDLVRDMTRWGYQAAMHKRWYTEAELSEAGILAERGIETGHIGEVD